MKKQISSFSKVSLVLFSGLFALELSASKPKLLSISEFPICKDSQKNIQGIDESLTGYYFTKQDLNQFPLIARINKTGVTHVAVVGYTSERGEYVTPERSLDALLKQGYCLREKYILQKDGSYVYEYAFVLKYINKAGVWMRSIQRTAFKFDTNKKKYSYKMSGHSFAFLLVLPLGGVGVVGAWTSKDLARADLDSELSGIEKN